MKSVRDPLQPVEDASPASADNTQDTAVHRALHAAIVESSDDAILSKDLNGVIRSANAAAERLFGYSAAELIGRPVRMLIPADRQGEEDEILRRIRRGERVEHFETVRLRKNGQPVEISLTISPLLDQSGNVVGASKIARNITEQKRAAAAQAYLAAVVDSSDDAIIAKDLDGIIQSSNAAAERLFGYAASELVGRPVRILIPPERQSEEDDILARIRRGERIEHFETVRVAKDGTRLNISLTVSPVRDAAGRIIGVSKIARDITERKRAAAELAAQQEWFRVTLGSIGDGVIASSPDGEVTYMNAPAEALTGWSSEHARGRALAEVFHIISSETRQPVDSPVALVMRTGDVAGLSRQCILVSRDGSEHHIADSAAPILADGSIIGVVLVFRDVTDERRADEAIAEQREWLQTTLESIADAVIATDTSGRIVFMNSVAERLTRWRAAAARGRPFEEVFRIVDETRRLPVRSPVNRVLQKGAVAGEARETLLIAADGTEHPIEDSAAPIRNHAGLTVGVVLVFRDVTFRRRVEADRQHAAAERERLLEAERAARAEAERASRVKDDFVAMVSHELRTPLNAILGWTQLMMRTPRSEEVIERGLAVVDRNTRVQAQLISDLLDISRIVAGKLRLEIQAVDLTSIVNDAIETVQQEADAKGIQIIRQFDDSAAMMAGDPARLQQVVWNLLSNAIKFTPRAGRVIVHLRSTQSRTEIAVVDNGAGIRPEFLPHVFERFQQADRSITRRFGGLGLGLAIVKHLVELHGGSVTAESAGEDLGATFRIVLPGSPVCQGSKAHPAPAGAYAYEHVSLANIRVLVVEDEPDTREFVKRLLETQGASVVAVTSAREALSAFSTERPHMLISDIGLPEVDGYDLIQQIRHQESGAPGGIPAIALTAYARSEDRTRALRAGYQAHIAKPIEPGELVATIASFAELINRQWRG